MNIARIGAALFYFFTKKPANKVFTVFFYNLDRNLATVPSEDILKKKNIDPAYILPKQYYKFLNIFSRKKANILPPHRPYDYKIKLLLKTTPPLGPLYGISQNEQKKLRKYLDENLKKGFIRASYLPAASSVLFVKKPGEGLRFYVNYRGLNAIIVKS